jgi:hypothetical protein
LLFLFEPRQCVAATVAQLQYRHAGARIPAATSCNNMSIAVAHEAEVGILLGAHERAIAALIC